MNELTKELQEIPVPRAVLVAYKYEDGPYGKRQKYHLELRPVNRDGKMGAAVPVSHEFMNTLVENYSVEMNGMPYGQIPPGLLWCDTRRGHEKYVWYNPPGKRRMYFTKGLNIENGEFNLPGIIYVVERGGLNVFAFKGERPGMDDRLCKAPYFNVNATSGSVCLGNASLQIPEAPTFDRWLEYWEKRFWMSEFSHLAVGETPQEAISSSSRKKPGTILSTKTSSYFLKNG